MCQNLRMMSSTSQAAMAQTCSRVVRTRMQYLLCSSRSCKLRIQMLALSLLSVGSECIKLSFCHVVTTLGTRLSVPDSGVSWWLRWVSTDNEWALLQENRFIVGSMFSHTAPLANVERSSVWKQFWVPCLQQGIREHQFLQVGFY